MNVGRKRPSALQLHLDSNGERKDKDKGKDSTPGLSAKAPPTAYLATTPQPQSAALQHTKHLESIHATALKYWERYDNADCAIVLPLDDHSSAVKRSRSFSHLLDAGGSSTQLLSPHTLHAPNILPQRRRSSEVSISAAAAASAGLSSSMFNYDIALPESLDDSSNTLFWPPLRTDDPTPRASIASVATIRPSQSRKHSLAADPLSMLRPDAEGGEAGGGGGLGEGKTTSDTPGETNESARTHSHIQPRLLILHLHKDFLTSQSNLFKAIFSKLDSLGVEKSGEGGDGKENKSFTPNFTGIQEKTEHIAAETRETLAKLHKLPQDVAARSTTVPRILPHTRSIYLPLPDSHSLLYLIQALYFGHGPFLESHLESQLVKWEGLVQNAEYLGVDHWIKRVLGRWWNRHVNLGKRRVSGVMSSGSGSGLLTPESANVSGGFGARRSVSSGHGHAPHTPLTALPHLTQAHTHNAHARSIRRSSAVHQYSHNHSHLKQSLHEFDLGAGCAAGSAHPLHTPPRLESVDPVAVHSTPLNHDSYNQPPSPKSEEVLSKRLRNI